MARRTLRPHERITVDGFPAMLRAYRDARLAQNYSPLTVENFVKMIGYFIEWAEARKIEHPSQITRTDIEAYAEHLADVRRSGKRLAARTQHQRLLSLRMFFRFLSRQDIIAFNPSEHVELPRLGQRLPRTVLTHQEMERVLAQPDIELDLGLRDRAILETFYSTGIRRSELMRLELRDLDPARQVLAVRQGKGHRDRFVPIGERAIDWIDRYLVKVRPSHVVDPERTTLFLSEYGEPMTIHQLSNRVGGYIDDARLGKSGSCHLIRHSMATQMLERGADLRIIQQILGHQSIGTTSIYTHVSIRHLTDVHRASHPTADHHPAPMALEEE